MNFGEDKEKTERRDKEEEEVTGQNREQG